MSAVRSPFGGTVARRAWAVDDADAAWPHLAIPDAPWIPVSPMTGPRLLDRPVATVEALVARARHRRLAAAPAAAAYGVTFPNRTFNAYVTDPRREGDAYVLSELPAAATANPDNLAVAIAYGEDGAPVDGELSPGTVLTPDIESFEVDRRQSLVNHELTHTVQSVRWDR